MLCIKLIIPILKYSFMIENSDSWVGPVGRLCWYEGQRWTKRNRRTHKNSLLYILQFILSDFLPAARYEAHRSMDHTPSPYFPPFNHPRYWDIHSHSQKPSADIKAPLYSLLTSVLLHNWRYFFKPSVVRSLGNPASPTQRLIRIWYCRLKAICVLCSG